MDRLNILHWVGTGNLPKDPERTATSGVVRAALEIAAAQSCRGHQVTVASVARTEWHTKWDGVLLVGRPPARWARGQWHGKVLDFSQHVPLVTMTRRKRYDVVHAHLYAYLRGVRADTRIVHFHADPLYEGSKDSMFSGRDFDAVSRSADGVVVVSRYIESRVRPNLENTVPIIVIPNGVRNSTRKISHSTEAMSDLRSQLGVPRSAFVIVYVGAIIQEKGLAVLARAFRQLWEHNPSLYFMVAGSSTLWDSEFVKSLPDYEQEVQSLLLPVIGAGNCRLLGPVAARDMAQIYQASDVLVVPSVWPEPFPLVILEAMSYGLPVIASDIGGIPELVDDKVGRLFEAGNIKACKEAVEEIVANITLRNSLGQTAVGVAKSYTWPRAAESLDEFYRYAKFNRRTARKRNVSGRTT